MYFNRQFWILLKLTILPINILKRIIMSKYAHPMLYPWTNEQVIQYTNLHPLAYQVLIPNPEYIRWNVLEQNRKNYPVYSKYPEKITWRALSHNPRLKQLIRTDIRQIAW